MCGTSSFVVILGERYELGMQIILGFRNISEGSHVYIRPIDTVE